MNPQEMSMKTDDANTNDTLKQPVLTPAQTAMPHGVTPDRLAAVLQSAGYRATITETNGILEVKSAAQGLNFFARFGNKAGPERQYLDFTFFCPLAVHGELSPSILDIWNRVRRFARLNREQQLLILSMDVLAAGGVPDLYLLAQCELWDGMIRDLILHLRSSGATPPPAAAPDPAPTIVPSNGAERH
jgi:hypothetical protein